MTILIFALALGALFLAILTFALARTAGLSDEAMERHFEERRRIPPKGW